MGGEAAQGPVRKALASPSVRVRTQVAAYLGDARDTRFTKDLGALLADGVPGVRRSALEALRAMNDPASFPFLLPATLDEDEEIAAGAVRALAALGDGRALARIALLAGSPHAQVRAALAGAIPALGGLPVHAAAFDTLVSDADRSVRAAAATALRDHPSPEAGGPLQKLGKDAQATIRRIVVQAWREQPAGPAPAAALVGFLADADERVRATAILALGTRRPPGAAEAIAARAGDPSPVVREAIASTLGELEGDAAGDALARLATDSEPQVRAVAVVASAARGGSKALAIAEAAVEDESPVVRREAVRALGKVGSAGALARLRALAAAGDVPLRVAAIEQLGALKDRASLALLRKIAQEPVEAVRAAANRALTALGV
jgi:HEAT repeat protein